MGTWQDGLNDVGNWKGPKEEREQFKKEIASMMVIWVQQTRHDLREELSSGSPGNQWNDLGLASAFGTDQAWKAFFGEVSAHINQENIRAAASETATFAEGRWNQRRKRAPDRCPPNPVIKMMFQAATAFVDTLWVVEE